MNKNYIYIAVIIALVAGGAIFGMSRNNKTDDVTDALFISPSLTPSLGLSPTPSQTTRSTVKGTPKPTPGVIMGEVNSYQSWVDWLGPIDRHLVLDENCTSIVPSQVAYPNNTKIMLDNSFSPKSHILKIGDTEYSLGANSWLIVTLSSATLPAKLTMFCGPMELGQLDLE